MSMRRLAFEVRRWLEEHHLDAKGAELVLLLPDGREAFFARMALKRELTPELVHSADVTLRPECLAEVYGVKINIVGRTEFSAAAVQVGLGPLPSDSD